MRSIRRATQRAGIAGIAFASVFLLATCDLDKIVGSKVDSAGAIDSTALTLTGGTEVTLGGTATVGVTSTRADLTQVGKEFTSSDPTTISVVKTSGVMTGVKIGQATVTARITAPELGAGVQRSELVRVRYKGIKVITPTATDSIQGLGQTRSVTIQGTNSAGATQTGLLTADSLKSRDTTVVRLAGTTLTAKKGGTTFLVAFFDGTLKDSVAVRVRQVAKSIAFPTTDYTARHVNFNLTVPLTVKDVADSIIPTPTLTWRTKNAANATIGATTGILQVKSLASDSVWAKMDTVERGQKIVVSQVPGILVKFAGDAQTDTVALPIAIVPTVEVRDSGNTVIQGSSVTFRAGVGLNAVVQDTVQITDVNGRAKPTSWKLGDNAGAQTLLAVAGNNQTATFNATAVASVPKKLAFVVNPTSAAIGIAISPAITVQVQDSLGNPITNATTSITLSLSNNPGGATLAGTLTVAAVAGTATFNNISLNAGGTGYALQASAAGLTSAISNGFDVFGTANKVAFTTQPVGTTAGATLSPVRVTVQDANGNRVATSTASVTVAFNANPGGSTLSGTLTVAAVAGVATFSTLSINNAASGYTLQAASTGLTTGVSSSFTISAVGPASKLAYSVQPSNVVAGVAILPSMKVQVQDVNGALVTSSTQQVTLSIESTSPTGGTLGGTTSRNAVAGVATFDDISINKAGTGFKLLATATGTTLTTATSNTFNVTVGTATKLGFVQQPTHTVAGSTMSPAVTVEVQDASGNRVTTGSSVNVTLAFTSGTCTSATLSGGSAQATTAGVATFSSLSISTQATSCSLTATSSPLTQIASTNFNSIASNGAARLSFTTEPSASGTAGTALAVAPVVAFQDVNGNNVAATATTVSLTVLSGPANITSGTTSVFTATTGTFNSLVFNTAGAYRLLVSATGYRPDTSQLITINPASASRVSFVTQPVNTTAGVPFANALQVAVQDNFGNTIAGASNSITITANMQVAPFSPARFNNGLFQVTAVASNGVATFTGLAVRTAATSFNFFPSSGGLTSFSSNLFDITAAPLSALGFAVQPPSTATTAQAMAPAIQVAGQDSVGNTISDFSNAVTVALTGGTAGATLSGTKTVAPVGGIASFNTLAVDRTGSGYQLAASASGVTSATSNTFTVDPFVVSSGPTFNDFALLGSTVYFVGGSALKSVPTTGGTATTIIGSNNATKITTDGTNIYWAEQGLANSGDAFIKKYVPGGAVSTLTAAMTSLVPTFIEKIYSDGISVYFNARNAAGTGQAIRSVPVGSVSVPPTDVFPNAGNFSTPYFTVNAGFIYFFDPVATTIRRMTTVGGSLTTLSTAGLTAQRLAIEGTTLYFNDGVTLKSIPNANTAGSPVTPTTVFTAPGTVYEITSNAGNLYFDFDALLRRYSPSDFTTFALLSNNAYQGFLPFQFSATDLFFYDRNARLVRVPK